MSDYWVKFYEGFWDSSVSTLRNPNATTLALWLITKARRRDGWYKGVKIPRGATAYSERELAKKLGMSHDAIRYAKEQLKEVSFITHRTTHHFSIAYISNYDKYQPRNPTPYTTVTPHQPHTNPTTSPVTIEGRRKKEDNTVLKKSKEADKRFKKLIEKGEVSL